MSLLVTLERRRFSGVAPSLSLREAKGEGAEDGPALAALSLSPMEIARGVVLLISGRCCDDEVGSSDGVSPMFASARYICVSCSASSPSMLMADDRGKRPDESRFSRSLS